MIYTARIKVYRQLGLSLSSVSERQAKAIYIFHNGILYINNRSRLLILNVPQILNLSGYKHKLLVITPYNT